MNVLKPMALSLLLVSLPCAFAAPLPPKSGNSVKYTVADIGTLGGSESAARALNEAGEVVGDSDLAAPVSPGQKAAKTYPHAFLWKKGRIEDLDNRTNTFVSAATGINNQGECVGTNGKACLWKGGHCQSLGTLPGNHFSGALSIANSINDKGQVCGFSDTPNNHHAFLWQKGTMTDLTPGQDEESVALSINNQGQMVGWIQKLPHLEQAAYWSQGKTTLLGSLPRGTLSDANCINNAGQIVGNVNVLFGKEQTFLWTSKQGMVRLNAPGGGNSKASGINNRGQIVGFYNLPPHVPHACLWQQGVVKDLNDLIPPHSGWVFKSAKAINDRGQITGIGQINGKNHAFLLTPK